MMVAPAVAAAGIGAVADLAGGVLDNYFNKQAADKSYKFQKKVLQNQVQWRVADAVAAGLHPLAALGLNPASGPVAGTAGSSMGSALSSMGQNIGRAVEASMSDEDKLLSRALMRQSLTSNELQNAHLRAQTALLNQQIAGSGNVGKGDRGGGASMVTRYGFDNTAYPMPPGRSGENAGELGEIGQETTGANVVFKQVANGGMPRTTVYDNRGKGWEGMYNDMTRLRAWLNSWQVGM